jgi:hypothetical protein
MATNISADDFKVLADQTGLKLSDAQRATLYEAYGYVEKMAERVRTPRGREAEPALIFVPEVR